jgi:hypothetical protein
MQLSDIIPWGRDFDEYWAMFALSEQDLRRQILGCGDGPASFYAEATALGIHVVSVDPIYEFCASDIESRVTATFETVMSQARAQADRYCWDRFASPDDLGAARLDAMRRFIADYERGKQASRYVAGALPRLPFRDASFDLGLCSHLLFLYSDHLSFDQHVAAARELFRIAGDVRLFPLLTLSGGVSPHVLPLSDILRREGRAVDEIRVDYEFMRGGNVMLRVRRRPSPLSAI